MNEEFKAKPRQNILGEPVFTIDPPKNAPKRPEPTYEEPIPHPMAQTSTPEPVMDVNSVTKNAPHRARLNSKTKKIFVVAIGLIVIAVLTISVITYLRPKTGAPKSTESAQGVSSIEGKEVLIPLYSPKNLPPGYTDNNDTKLLKDNVVYYSITGPKKDLYYVTQQSLPANFDFNAFNKKFLNPDTFTTEVGTVILGPVGSSVIGSVRTNKNTWIIINSSETATQAGLTAVIRSLSLD